MSRWRTVVRRDVDVFAELADWWDAQDGPRELPLLRSNVLAAWNEGFEHPSSRRAVHLLLRGDEPVAALPLFRVRGRLRSMGREWPGAFDVVASDAGDVVERLPEWLASLPILQLYRVRDESPIVRWAAERKSWVTQQVFDAPYVDLTSGRAGVDAGTSRELRKSLRRRRRRMDELGDVRVVDQPVRSADDELLGAGLAMEAAGWKGPAAVAVRTNPEAEAWFSALLAECAPSGALRTAGLFVDDRLVAWACDLVVGSRRYGLLSAYDEAPSIARLSPGNLLLDQLFDAAISEGLDTYELGRGVDWKSSWSDARRRYHDFRIFGSGPIGRLAFAVRGRKSSRG